MSGLMANPGDSLSNSEARVPRAEKVDGGGVESDGELAEKERFATFGWVILHLESGRHIGRRTVNMLNGRLHGIIAISLFWI